MNKNLKIAAVAVTFTLVIGFLGHSIASASSTLKDSIIGSLIDNNTASTTLNAIVANDSTFQLGYTSQAGYTYSYTVYHEEAEEWENLNVFGFASYKAAMKDYMANI